VNRGAINVIESEYRTSSDVFNTYLTTLFMKRHLSEPMADFIHLNNLFKKQHYIITYDLKKTGHSAFSLITVCTIPGNIPS
jgi:hypothetical protein